MFLKSIHHLSLVKLNDVTSFDKNIGIVWLKHILFKILCTTYTMHIKNKLLKQDKEKKSRILSI